MTLSLQNNPFRLAGIIILLCIVGGWAVVSNGTLVPVAVLGVAYTILTFLNPKVGLFAIVALLPFDSFFVVGDSVSLTRIIGFIAFAAWILSEKSLDTILEIAKQKLSVGLILFVSLSLASVLWSNYREPVVGALITLLQLLFLYFFVVSQVDSWKTLSQVLLVFAFSVFLSIPYAIYEFYFLSVERAGDGLSGSENSFAGMIVVTFALLVYYLQSQNSLKWQKLFAMVAIPLYIIGIAISLSRTSFLIFPIVIIFQLWAGNFRRHARLVVALLITFLIAAYFVPWASVERRIAETFEVSGLEDPDLLSMRGYIWKVAWIQFTDYPILGGGYDSYRQNFLWTYQFTVPGTNQIRTRGLSVHSTYLFVLANLGIVGSLLFLWILWNVYTLLRESLKKIRDDKDEEIALLIHTAGNCLLAYLIYSAATTTLKTKPFWIFLGIVQAIYIITHQQKKEAALLQE